MEPDALIQQMTDLVREQLRARAAGFWTIDDSRLIRVAFARDESMDRAVARDFAEATRAVPLDRDARLGIVGAAVTGLPTISRAAELPPDLGSGRWLRAFGAARSIAVPVEIQSDTRGSSPRRGILSVAFPPECLLGDESLVETIQAYAKDFLSPGPSRDRGFAS